MKKKLTNMHSISKRNLTRPTPKESWTCRSWKVWTWIYTKNEIPLLIID